MQTIENIELHKNQDSREFGFSDMLLYSHFIDDGVIYNCDGSYQKSFWCNGFEFESSEMHEKLGITRYLNLIFAGFETGWVIHVNSIRVKIHEYIEKEANYFDNNLLELMDKDRRYYFTKAQDLFVNKTAITFTYLPQNKLFNKLSSKFKETNKKAKDHDPYSFYFEHFIERLEQATRLINRALRLAPMDSNETVSYLHYLISGRWNKLQLSPATFVELRHYLAEDFVAGFEPKVGEMNIRVISIDQGFPEESQPLILERLNNLNFEFRWNTRFFFLTNTESRDNIQHLSDLHQQNILSPTASIAARSGMSANVNRAAYDLFDEAEEAKRASVISGVNHGKYNCCIVLYSEDESVLTERVKQVRQVLDELLFKNRIETMGAMQVYLGSLDGEIYKNRRRFLISTENLVEFMPISSAWMGYDAHPSKMYPDNSPPLFYVDTPTFGVFKGSLHWQDIGHSLILGSSGTGKSTLLLFLAFSQLRYKNSQVFAFDYKRSMMPFTYGINGEHYDIGSDDTMFQPLSEVDTMKGFDFAVEWISLICELNHLRLTSENISAIHDGIASLRQLPVELRTIHAFYIHVSGVNLAVAEIFKAYQGEDTLKAKVFSANKDKIKLNRFNVFEMSEVMDKGETTIIPVLKYLFYKILSQLDGRPTTIIIEEAWMAFNNPTFSKELAKWLDTMRKLNVNIVMVTLNVAQVAKSSIKDTLLQQCATTLLTPNFKLAKDETIRQAYIEFGLTPCQLDILANAQAKRQYYLINPDGCKLFNLDMDNFKISKAFFCRIGIEDLLKAKDIKNYHQENFAKKWLDYCGLHEYAMQL
ncbi:MAG: hypothetical protein K2P99_03070 [Burkholderiales bacterium]|nr:hypothetical protein [Burkholderiales bacterium]